MKALFTKKANDIAFCLWCLVTMPFLLVPIFNYEHRDVGMIGLYCTSAVMVLYLLVEVAYHYCTKIMRTRRLRVVR